MRELQDLVMAGLDPGIFVDCRVKPGNDDFYTQG
jgi:hypothetical protein